MKELRYFSTICRHGSDILSSEGMNTEKHCIQHGTYSVFDHSLFVTSMCIRLSRAMKLKVNERALVRGALLHDYFLYDWHLPSKIKKTHGFTHPGAALKNAEKDFSLGKIEKDMIKRHMFPLTPIPPRYKESIILCISDKICATYETIGGFKKRITGRRNRR